MPELIAIHGGAYLMAGTIAQSITATQHREKPPQVFAYAKPPQDLGWMGPPATRGLAADESVTYWDLCETTLREQDKAHLRLAWRTAQHSAPHPNLSAELLTKLLHGQFEDTGPPEGREVPDIVVFDDLGHRLRDITLDEQIVFASDAAQRANFDALAAKMQKPGLGNEETLTGALNLLLARLEYGASLAARKKTNDLLEPVVIASIIRGLPNLESPATLRNRLYRNKELRKRTIVLLNADDLRRLPLSISSGLSWERTAQDTIVEMSRSQLVRDYLKFGHVVVCFGVTGALHISQLNPGEWSYTLFFDPDRDDITWADSNRDGTVLGASAIFAATVVERLTRICHRRDGAPSLFDLTRVLADATRSAIQRSQQLVLNGYDKKLLDVGGLSNENAIGPEIFTPELLRGEGNFARFIPRIPVPPVRLRNWSILHQSAHSRIGSVACDIVMHGTKSALNNPRATIDLIVEAWLWLLKPTVALWIQQSTSGQPPRASDVTSEIRRIGEYLATDRLIETNYDCQLHDAMARCFDYDQGRTFESIGAGVAACFAAVPSEIEVWQLLHDRLQELLAISSPADSLQDEFAVDPTIASVVRLGKQEIGKDRRLVFVDRREIEGIRTIQRLIDSHLELRNPDRPLSIAVFGPPGSGKSSAIKQIVAMINRDKEHARIKQFNLSQFTKAEQLKDAFKQITDISAISLTPVAFFDEFDCEFNSAQLGWLKYFLAPMEDGEYGDSPVKNAILVFAGGTSSTFSDFSLEHRATTDPQWIEFSRAKGPDFVSRLRGHLNVVGINPADADDELYLIRRAILIRHLLTAQQNLADREPAKIDPDLLRAVLHVPLYKHGGRSVRMLLQMCQSHDGRLSKSAVPPLHQLNMQVDGKAFLDLIADVWTDGKN